MPAGFQFIGTATPTAFNYAEDPSDVAGYVELSVGGAPGTGPGCLGLCVPPCCLKPR